MQIWDIGAELDTLASVQGDSNELRDTVHLAAQHAHKHDDEGFALDWSKVSEGRLASGDCQSAVHVWDPAQGGHWSVSQPYRGHEGPVEDVQWSPSDASQFMSCSVDQSIKVWDTRLGQTAQLSVPAHTADVNVISWNASVAYSLASGGDDGRLRVWDLRSFEEPVADFAYHRFAAVHALQTYDGDVLLTMVPRGASTSPSLKLVTAGVRSLQWSGVHTSAQCCRQRPPTMFWRSGILLSKEIPRRR